MVEPVLWEGRQMTSVVLMAGIGAGVLFNLVNNDSSRACQEAFLTPQKISRNHSDSRTAIDTSRRGSVP